MYNFILSMWVAGKVTQAKVRSYCPTFIQQTEVELILATPQLQ